MVPGLKKVNAVIADKIDNAVLLSKASRPNAGEEIFERLRLANACERIAHDGLNKIECSHGSLSIDLHPIPEVLAEFRLEDGISCFIFQSRQPSENLLKLKAVPHVLMPAQLK